MKTAKKSWKVVVSGLLGVLIAAALCLSCKNAVASGVNSPGDGTNGATLISYTAEQVDGESGLITSTGIKLTFESEVSDLVKDQINGNITKGNLSGSGNVWIIEIRDVTAEGEVSISINNAAIEKTEKKVMVYKASGDALPKLVRATRIDSTTLAVKFSKPVTDAAGNRFTVTKTEGGETFTVLSATANDAVVTLALVGVGTGQLSGLTITISDNAVKDLTGNSAVADAIGVSVPGESFSFTVRTTGANESFALPTSGRLNNVEKSYDWTISWGDSIIETKTGSSSNSDGISHIYTTAGDHQITVTPNGSVDAWLGAFGFATGDSGANAQANRNKVISVDFVITPLMTRTQAQIDGNTAPTYEWAYTFYYCKNSAFKMGDNLKFSTEWNDITTVGEYFAAQMFYYCNGAAFTMGKAFNMPQGITRAGDRFAYQMFYNCDGASFTMGAAFNMPQNITSVGNDFASAMFFYCDKAAFRMNGVFNLPQGITKVGNNFASSMFYNCIGDNFTMNDIFNLPEGIITEGAESVGGFCNAIFTGCKGAKFKMNDVFNLPQGITKVDNNFGAFMFMNCNGAAFTMNDVFNLPQSITTVGSKFASSMFMNCKGTGFRVNSVITLPNVSGAEAFLTMFSLDTGAATQTRNAASIINGAPTPSYASKAFGPSGSVWPDYGTIDTNWKQ
jgi:nitrogen regulatory protein PII